MQFNYVKAWAELVLPAVKALAPETKTLFLGMVEQARHLHQNNALLIPWPEGLRERFEALPAEELCRAARVMYFFGHWSPLGTAAETGGATWKFSNLADQVLRCRFLSDCPRDGYTIQKNRTNTISVAVHEGAVRLQIERTSSEYFWVWEEICSAAQLQLDQVMGLLEAAPRKLGIPEAYEILQEARSKCADTWWSSWFGAGLERFEGPAAEIEASERAIKASPIFARDEHLCTLFS